MVFTNVVAYPVNPSDPDKSGRAFTGVLTYAVAYFSATGTKIGADQLNRVDVTTGGFFDSSTMIQGPACDTAFTEGTEYKLQLLPDGNIHGFHLKDSVPGRVGLEIHYRIREVGSSGCIVFVDGEIKPPEISHLAWRDHPNNNSTVWGRFDRLMRQTRNCKCQGTNLVPLTVVYEDDAADPKPTYVWKPGEPS